MTPATGIQKPQRRRSDAYRAKWIAAFAAAEIASIVAGFGSASFLPMPQYNIVPAVVALIVLAAGWALCAWLSCDLALAWLGPLGGNLCIMLVVIAALAVDSPRNLVGPAMGLLTATSVIAALGGLVCGVTVYTRIGLLKRSGRPIPGERVPGLCTRCGYDLTGSTAGPCPECGTPNTPPANEGSAGR